MLERFALGEIDLAGLRGWIAPILAADPLGVAETSGAGWETAPERTRLFWRLVYQVEVSTDEDGIRCDTARILACLDSTGDVSITHDMLPLLLDQERMSTIVERHLAGIISRTSFLSAVSESGYPTHMKRWLEVASPQSLERMATLLRTGAYREVIVTLNEIPG